MTLTTAAGLACTAALVVFWLYVAGLHSLPVLALALGCGVIAAALLEED